VSRRRSGFIGGSLTMGPFCTLGRPGKPEEIAAPILLLASKGGMYMNDTCINVDGGRWLVCTPWLGCCWLKLD
jgi:NAD(P)-dependent dehydrogenase (short-subunit alcohol dehydrogenase family)